MRSHPCTGSPSLIHWIFTPYASKCSPQSRLRRVGALSGEVEQVRCIADSRVIARLDRAIYTPDRAYRIT
jgi:hypothetical protein